MNRCSFCQCKPTHETLCICLVCNDAVRIRITLLILLQSIEWGAHLCSWAWHSNRNIYGVWLFLHTGILSTIYIVVFNIVTDSARGFAKFSAHKQTNAFRHVRRMEKSCQRRTHVPIWNAHRFRRVHLCQGANVSCARLQNKTAVNKSCTPKFSCNMNMVGSDNTRPISNICWKRATCEWLLQVWFHMYTPLRIMLGTRSRNKHRRGSVYCVTGFQLCGDKSRFPTYALPELEDKP